MKKFIKMGLASLGLVSISSLSTQAATVYWDSNGTTAGAGATPTGTWGTSSFWSADPTGTAATGAYGSGSDVVFSAGTDAINAYTVTMSANQSAASMTFNNAGAVTMSGSGNHDLITTGNITLNSGAGAVTIGNTAANTNIAERIGTDQTWTNNSGSQLRFVNAVSGLATGTTPVTLTIAGSGSGIVLFSNSLNDGTAGAVVSLVINSTGGGTQYGGGSYSGGTTIKSGTLITGNNGNFGAGAVLLGDTSGSANATLTANSNGTVIANNITVQAGSSGNTLTIGNNGASPTLSGNLTLNNAVTFSGAGVTTLTGGLSGSGNITVTGGILAFNRGATSFTLANNISGTGGLTQAGAGILTLTGATGGATTYTGGTKVNAGTVKLDFSAAGAPSSNIISSSSVLTLGGGTLNVVLSNGATANTQTFASTTFTGNTSSILSVNQNGNTNASSGLALGALTRNAGSTVDFTLPTTGTVTSSTTTSSGTNKVNGNGIAYSTVGGNTWLTNNAGTLGALASGSYQIDTFAASGDTDIQANDAPLAFTVNTLRFNTANKTLTLNSSGASTVTAGGILVTSAGTGSVITGAAGATLQPGATGKEFVIHNYADLVIDAPIVNNGVNATILTAAGTGTTILSGANTYTGATNINKGATLQLGDGGTSGSIGTAAIADNGTLTFNRSDTVTLSNVITGTGNVVQNGTGTTVLSGGSTTVLNNTNSYSGTTTLNAGILQGKDSHQASDTFNPFGTSALVLNGGTLQLRANGSAASGRTIAAANSVTIGNSAVTIDVNNSAGTTGWINNSIGFSGNLSLGSGQLNVTGGNGYFLRFAGPVTLTGNATLNPTTAGLNFAGAIGDGGNAYSITKTGSGTVTLGVASTYTGGTNLNAGTVSILNAASLGSSGALAFGGGTLQYNGINTDLSSRFSTAASQAYSIDTNSQNVTLATALTSAGGTLTKIGAGNLTLTGANTFNGATTISGGALLVIGSGSLGSGNYSGAITNNAALTFTTTASQILGGAISGTGSLSLTGANTLTLSGANSYQGGTTLGNAGGTIIVGNKDALGTGTLTATTGSLQANTSLTGANKLANNVTLTALTVNGSNNLEIGGKVTGATGNNRTLSSSITGGNMLTLNDVDISNDAGATARTFTIAGTGNTVVNGTIANGTGTSTANVLNISNTGITTLNGTGSTYTGGTTLTAGGTLAIGADSTSSGVGGTVTGGPLGTGTLTITNGAANLIASGAARTIANNIAATSSMNIGGSNDLTMNGNMSWGGSNTLTVNNSGLTTFGGLFSMRNDGLIAQRSLTIAGTGLVQINGALVNGSTSNGILTNSGTGTTVLGGNNSYSGTTSINVGRTVRLGNANGLGFGGVSDINIGGTTNVAIGGTLDLNGQTPVNESITINGTGVGGNGALINSNTGTTAVIGSGLEAVKLTAAGSGYSSAPTVVIANGGGATANALLGLSAASISTALNGSTYTVAPTVTISGGGGSGATATVSTAGVVTIVSYGSGYTSAPTIAISGGTFTGGTGMTATGNATNFIVAGLQMITPGSGAASPTVSLTGGGGSGAAATANISSVALNDTAAGSNAIGGAGDITIDGLVTGGAANPLTKVGNGALTLTNANTYTGATTVSAGSLIAGAAAPSGSVGAFGNAVSAITLGNAATTTNNSSAAVLTGGAFTVARAVTIANQATTGSYAIGGNTANISTFSGLVTANQSFNVSQVSGGTLNVTGGITGGNAGAKTVTFNNVGAVNVNTTGISNGLGTMSVAQTGSGTTTFNAVNTYTGSTSVSGGTLLIGSTGTINNTSGVAVSTGGTFRYNSNTAYSGGAITNSGGSITGSGNLGSTVLGGSGSVDPGNSPGILTAGSTDPTAGLDYNFEFTAANTAPTWSAATNSGNDVLRLTGSTPFSAALTTGNTISLYLNVGSLSASDVFTGGFFTDNSASFLSSIAGADLEFYLAGTGSTTYNGVSTYGLYTGPLSFTLNTVQVGAANFAGGTVTNGYVMEFSAVPEPSTFALVGLGLGLGALYFLRKKNSKKV